MKTRVLVFLLLCLTASATCLNAKEKNNPPAKGNSLSFTENKGQFADQNYQARPDVLFGGTDGQMAFHITKTGISYQQYRADAFRETEDPKTKEKRNEIVQQTIYRTDIKWINANLNPTIHTDAALPGYNNYYLQQCPDGAIEVRSYQGITLQNIYNNIDLHYYENLGHLKCDYIVAPHADYKQIQLKVSGATLQLQNDGSLIIETPLGKIIEQAPIVYQNGNRLEAHYKINNNQIGFEIKNYDENFDLMIDPVTRLWGTYYGGSGDDLCTSIKVDGSGNVYMAGHSGSSTGTTIATTGSHQNVFGGGAFDAYLTKFTSAGVRIWATYYGGSGSDFATCCAIDAGNNIFITGYTNTSASGVIATPGSHQSAYGGGNYDAYLVQFNASGVRLWGSYYGGANIDVGGFCSIDPSGNVYVAGYTAGSTGTEIATAASHQSTYGGGNLDAFLAKFSNAGVRSWATYYGGTLTDASYACATDVTGNVYMSGHTGSTGGTAIATAGSHQSASNGGDDGYLVKFNSSGVRQWATYYGGVANENVFGCATDGSGNVYIAGHSASIGGTAIATPGSHQSTSGGGWDIMAVKFSSSGVRLWGTYYGATGTDCGWSCSTDATGDLYVIGYAANSTGAVIATPGSHQTIYGGGTYDTYLVKFRGNGVRLWGTYYGGTGDESGNSCASDGSGYVYLSGAGNSASGTVIATPGSHQPTSAGSNDAFLVKFEDCNLYNAAVLGTVCAAGTLSLSVNSVGALSPTYNWSGPNSFISTIQNPTIANVSVTNLGIYSLTLNYGNCTESVTVQVSNINPQPTVTVNSGTICAGNKFVIVPSGANAYTVTGGSFTVNPSTTNTYSVTGTSTAGCTSAPVESKVTVSPCTGLTENGLTGNAQSVLIYPNPGSGNLNIESVEKANVRLIDLQGRVLDDFSINAGINSVSLDQFENGVYFLEVTGVHGMQIVRVVKQ